MAGEMVLLVVIAALVLRHAAIADAASCVMSRVHRLRVVPERQPRLGLLLVLALQSLFYDRRGPQQM